MRGGNLNLVDHAEELTEKELLLGWRKSRHTNGLGSVQVVSIHNKEATVHR
jgi:hypothetical protein